MRNRSLYLLKRALPRYLLKRAPPRYLLGPASPRFFVYSRVRFISVAHFNSAPCYALRARGHRHFPKVCLGESLRLVGPYARPREGEYRAVDAPDGSRGLYVRRRLGGERTYCIFLELDGRRLDKRRQRGALKLLMCAAATLRGAPRARAVLRGMSRSLVSATNIILSPLLSVFFFFMGGGGFN